MECHEQFGWGDGRAALARTGDVVTFDNADDYSPWASADAYADFILGIYGADALVPLKRADAPAAEIAAPILKRPEVPARLVLRVATELGYSGRRRRESASRYLESQSAEDITRAMLVFD